MVSPGGLPNLGTASAEMLVQAGIHTIAQLREMGAVVAYQRVRDSGQRPSLNLLWAIHAGLENRHWTTVRAEEKATLLADLKALRQ